MLNPDKVKLAIAPIGWTNDDMPDLGSENTFEQCISEMALAGFKGTEIGNKYPQDPAVLKKYLDIRGLSVCNAWFSSYLTSKPYEETIEAFKAHCDKLHFLGAKVIGASEQGNSIQGDLTKSILEEKPCYTEEQWEIVTKGFNEMGEYARSKGMFFTVHHHMGTGVQTAEEIDKLMELTDSELVYLLFDSGHLTFAGIDPVPVLKKYVNRVKHVHLRMCALMFTTIRLCRSICLSLMRCAPVCSPFPVTAMLILSRFSIFFRIMIMRDGLLLRLSRIRRRQTPLNMPLRPEITSGKRRVFNAA